MSESFLYEQIAESVRQDIINGNLTPGDRLPSLREMTSRWNCTIGTVQRAYRELAQQGLITSRSGQGTKVVEKLPAQIETPLRRAALIHRAETFLLEVLTAGYSPPEIENAIRQALDRWRTLEHEEIPAPPQIIRFAGSHDLFLTWLSGNFSDIFPGYTLQLQFSGSLGGLIALAEGRAEIAGSHLWDKQSDTYNLPFIRRLLPGQKMTVLTVAHRRLGFILPKGNPQQIKGLTDLGRDGLRFGNRQSGSGSRVWLDANLDKAGLTADQILGYNSEMLTHLEVALAVAENKIDIGLGLEAAAHNYGLGFIPLTLEQYDLVIPSKIADTYPIKEVIGWFASSRAKQEIAKFPGYETHDTGKVFQVE